MAPLLHLHPCGICMVCGVVWHHPQTTSSLCYVHGVVTVVWNHPYIIILAACAQCGVALLPQHPCGLAYARARGLYLVPLPGPLLAGYSVGSTPDLAQAAPYRVGFSHSKTVDVIRAFKTLQRLGSAAGASKSTATATAARASAASFEPFVRATQPVYSHTNGGSNVVGAGAGLTTGSRAAPAAGSPPKLHLLGLVRHPADHAISNWAESFCHVKVILRTSNVMRGGADGCSVDLPAVGS